MIDVAPPSAPHRRSFPPSAARRSPEALPVQDPPAPLQAPRLLPPSAGSSAKHLVVFTAAAISARRWLRNSHERFVRDAKSP